MEFLQQRTSQFSWRPLLRNALAVRETKHEEENSEVIPFEESLIMEGWLRLSVRRLITIIRVLVSPCCFSCPLFVVVLVFLFPLLFIA